MHILLDKYYTITQDGDNNVIVTRPSMMGTVNTHTITSPYDAFDIAKWLWIWLKKHRHAELIQKAFPLMKAEDREFLITGITPEIWAKVVKKEEEQD
jgi:hypothetical protein